MNLDVRLVEEDMSVDVNMGEIYIVSDGNGQMVSNVRVSEVELLASEWVGDNNMWHQVVSIEGTTENTKVDLTPSAEQLAIFYHKDLALVAENEEGVVTVYAIGQRPLNDYIIPVTLTEVSE